jgi:hypothetical protein
VVSGFNRLVHGYEKATQWGTDRLDPLFTFSSLFFSYFLMGGWADTIAFSIWGVFASCLHFFSRSFTSIIAYLSTHFGCLHCLGGFFSISTNCPFFLSSLVWARFSVLSHDGNAWTRAGGLMVYIPGRDRMAFWTLYMTCVCPIET